MFHVDVLNGKYTIYDDVTKLRNTKFSPQPIDRTLTRVAQRATAQTARSNAGRLLSEFDQLSAQALKQSNRAVVPAARSATAVARFAKFGTVFRIGGGVASIVFGVVDIGGGVYELREIGRRVYAGELDYDIAMGKRILAGQKMVLGGAAIAAGILLIVPEPVITKAIAAGLTITIIAGHAVLMAVDYFLERTQAKRMEHRRELLVKISWKEQQKICYKQLQKMVESPSLAF